MICLSDAKLEKFPTGTIWALIGSAAYALYLVTLKRKVKDDQQLDIPMFFGNHANLPSKNLVINQLHSILSPNLFDQ